MCINSFNSTSSSFAPTKNSGYEISKKINEYLGVNFKYGCDLPENGGITGQMGKGFPKGTSPINPQPVIDVGHACWMA